MAAIGLWVRTTTRRHLAATVFLVVAAGLSAAIVAAAAQSARRGNGAVDRYLRTSRAYDVGVGACPPEVDVEAIDSPAFFFDNCGLDAQREFAALLTEHPMVEAVAVQGTSVVGITDPRASNRWGRLVLTSNSYSDGVSTPIGRPIVVSGSLPAPDARDEVVLGEAAARGAGVSVGDRIHLVSWAQDELDAAIDGRLAPTTAPIEVRVAAIVRFLADVQTADDGNLADTLLDSYVHLGPGFMAAHSEAFAGYGDSVTVRLRGGPVAIDEFTESVESYQGWHTDVFGHGETDLVALERAVDTERRATWMFAAIAGIAGLAFVGLTFGRQLRRELREVRTLRAVGFTRHDLRRLGAARALVIAVPAALVAVVATVALSPLSPLGVTRLLEFHDGVRIDLVPLLAVVCVLPLVMGAIGAALASSAGRTSVVANPAPGASSVFGLLGRSGARSTAAASFVRGGTTRAAMGMAAVAIVGVVGAAGLVASIDRVVDEPERYGAWWDVAVGQYSAYDTYEYGVEALRANPNVGSAAGYVGIDIGRLDDVDTSFVTALPVVGDPGPVLSEGRAPVAADEVALGAATARRLGKSVGESVTLTLDSIAASTVDDAPRELRVVGIAVMISPVETRRSAGEGAFLAPSILPSLNMIDVPGSIAVAFAPGVDRDAAIASLADEFGGSMRVSRPQPDVGNLARLRTVPWLLALLVAVLAAATVVHALATLVQRRRRDLGVLAAMGLAPRQLRSVAALAGSSVVAVGVFVGVPVGVIAGRLGWRGFADSIDIPSGPVVSWPALLVAPVAALVFANAVTAIVSRRIATATTAQSLRSE